GYEGALCDQCVTFPGCIYGSCIEPWQCVCDVNWGGLLCNKDTNECDMGVCVHARSCRNLIGGYLCDCLPGWAGPNCDIRNSSCQGLCLNGGHCEDSVSGSRCLCVPGFSGKHCQTGPSPCDSTPCQHGGQCVDKEGRALCSCPMGYSGISSTASTTQTIRNWRCDL
uniref:EGF-like domain-containing protein n=1 Tax=Hucho hucho TaxID=62062 RepID=A0A4W5JXN3_9TELE